MIKLKKMLQAFPEKYEAFTYTPNAEIIFHTIRFWEGNPLPDTLFIAYASELKNDFPDTLLNMIFIIISDCKLPASWNSPDHFRTVFVSKDSDPRKILNLLEDSGLRHQKHIFSLHNVIQAVSTGDLDEIINSVSQIVDASIAIFNKNLHLWIYKEAAGRKDLIFTENIKNGYYKALGLKNQLSTVYPTARNPHSGEIGTLSELRADDLELFFPIIIDGGRTEVIGYSYFYFHKSENAYNYFEELEQITQLISHAFWRQPQESENNSDYITFILKKIIDGTLNEHKFIADLLNRTAFKAKKNMLIMVINRFVSDENQKNMLVPCFSSNMREMDYVIRTHYPDSSAFYYATSLVVFINSNNENILSPEKMDELNNILKEHDCYAGISEPFHEITLYARNHYERALSAAIGAFVQASDRRYAFYKNIALKHLIFNLFLDENYGQGLKAVKQYIIDPNLLSLAEFDQQHHTDYIKTLQCYWHYSKNVNNICEYMHIHRSTLFYRLNKIREILQCDYNSYENMIQLSIGITILEALNIIVPEDIPPESDSV